MKNNKNNIKGFLLCPIPDDQKPINLYLGLKENPLTSWIIFERINYEKRILSFAGFILLGITFFRLPFLEEINYLLQWTLINCLITLSFLNVFLIGVCCRWKQVEESFTDSGLYYEEGSWFDVEVWDKPFAILKLDRFISSQLIEPFVERLSESISTLVSLNLILLLLFAFDTLDSIFLVVLEAQ